jgi:lipoprotein-anchoring transpeptidase ErfK/SrfK
MASEGGAGAHFNQTNSLLNQEFAMLLRSFGRTLPGLACLLILSGCGVPVASQSKAAVEARAKIINASMETSGSTMFGLFQIARIPREVVPFPEKHKPGTVVIHSSERRLYLVLGDGKALRYGIGVGRDGFRWNGTHTVTAKREWPDWTPPPEMLKREPKLPRHMEGGPDNPLGARAMYLGSSLYRIHGSNEEETIGGANSSGCFRMTNADVIDLYNRVKVGSTVIVKL